MTALFDPNEQPTRVQAYLRHTLGRQVRFIGAERIGEDTSSLPWRLDVEEDGARASYVLHIDRWRAEHEYEVLKAIQGLSLPTPQVYGRDLAGRWLGQPCFLSTFIHGQPLLAPMLAGESWADDLYIETVCALQSIGMEQLPAAARLFSRVVTAADFLEDAYEGFQEHADPLAEAAYHRLKDTMPPNPAVRFSNGDLWPENILVADRRLAAVIDFANAGFTDPIYEFIFPFFAAPTLRGRGTEERLCRRMGYDPAVLSWYRALELFDTWHWVVLKGKPFMDHSAESLRAGLETWLGEGEG
jgi:aminoglycoside phosphotransferase (APT) family kinase protein